MTLAVLAFGLSVGYLVVSLFIGADLLGRVLLGLISWFLLSLPLAMFVGRFIAYGNGPETSNQKDSVAHFRRAA